MKKESIKSFNPYKMIKDAITKRPFNMDGKEDGDVYYVHLVDVHNIVEKIKKHKEKRYEKGA